MTMVEAVRTPVDIDAMADLSQNFPDVPYSVLQDAAHLSYPRFLAAKAKRFMELDHTTNQNDLGITLLRLSKIFVDPYGHEIPVALRTERLAELQVLGTLLDGMRPNMIRH